MNSATATPPATNRQPKRCDMRMAQIGTMRQTESPMSTNHTRSSQRGTVKPLIVALLLTLLAPLSAFAQGTLAPVAQQVFLDASGNVLNNAKLCWYAAGTVTPQATYSDPTLMTLNANPVRTNSAGRPTTGGIYLSPTSYKLIVLSAGSDNTCATGTTIYSQDNISAIPATAVGLDIPGIAGENLTAADAVYLSDGSGALLAGRWYKADADTAYSSSTALQVGFAVAAMTSGDTGSIRVGGRVTGLSGLVVGTWYYVSGTAGAITATLPTNVRAVGAADTTTSLVMGDTAIPPLVPVGTSNGRLTLTTGTPVTTADVTAATTLFWTPYAGNRVDFYTTSGWTSLAVSQLSIAVPATTSTMYDVFIDYTAGVPALEVVAWTNDTTRAVALATQDGVYVQTSDADSRYVGSFRTTGVSGQTEDSFAKRYVWNYYNRVLRPMRVLEATNSWAYSTATMRQANGAAANQLDFVVGVNEVMVRGTVQAMVANSNDLTEMVTAIGFDSTTAAATGSTIAYVNAAVGRVRVNVAAVELFPGVGRHILTWLEYSGANPTTTWYGDNNTPTILQSGIFGSVEG